MSFRIVIPVGLFIIAVLIGLDVYLATDDLVGNTWSEILRTWAKATPLIPWACSVLLGHFFHPIDGLEPVVARPGSLALLIWVTALVGIVGLASSKAGYPIPTWAPIIPGCIVGALLWPV